MLDCGIHPGYNGMAALPFFDEIEPENVDLILITHFHLDHAASIPYFTQHTGFKGRIFMTHPTKAVMRMLLADNYIKLVNVTTEDVIYDEKDLNDCVEKIELIDYHQVLEHEGIKFWCYNAGHVLGAAMYMIEIAGVHILYTGDYSMEDDRHLMAAEVPSTSPDVLIVESTYGVQVHSPREEREERFKNTVTQIVCRGGRCLIPVFALGRAQELLLILDEHWQANKELQHIPIYYASRLASKAIRVYQTYINMMNEHIRRQMDVSNPFIFKHITNLKTIDQFEDLGPCVVMASPGMLQSGVSRQLLDRWCTDEKNGVVIPGYSVEGTLAKKILTSPEDITGLDGRNRPLRCSVEYISFSAHVDFVENKRFMEATSPMVHGEMNEMNRLRSELVRKYSRLSAEERPSILAPRNCQELTLEFHRDKMAKAVGKMTKVLQNNSEVNISGLLVTKDFNNRLMSPDDLETYTQLKLGGIKQTLKMTYYASFEALKLYFAEVYDDLNIEHMGKLGGKISVQNAAVVVHYPGDLRENGANLIFEWNASPVNDMIADSLIALALQAQTSPAGICLTTNNPIGIKCKHKHSDQSDHNEDNEISENRLNAALELVTFTLQDSYGSEGVRVDANNHCLTVSLNDKEFEPVAKIYLKASKNIYWHAEVQSEDAVVKSQ
eukprot:CAMPEP_0171457986 /NCGR_PEP_ID=MMETSP0945-20130129/3841_1 /TAXON_ID=109269 /ORGANISM="Vaucheria litorea, Strain CCMP2940" /LENGTH=665 /DNA_ID=CAMNT_0011983695 /DNA_START=110 /DNA_END=2105 /DNA_ORIENTATION=-